jgi:hypothetical protein
MNAEMREPPVQDGLFFTMSVTLDGQQVEPKRAARLQGAEPRIQLVKVVPTNADFDGVRLGTSDEIDHAAILKKSLAVTLSAAWPQ